MQYLLQRLTTAMAKGRPRRARGTRGSTRGRVQTRDAGGNTRGRTGGSANSTRGRGRKRTKRDDDSIGELSAAIDIEEVSITQNALANLSQQESQE